MRKYIGTILIVILTLAASLPAVASTYRCESIFLDSLTDILLDLDRNHQGLLFQNNSTPLPDKLSWNRKRKLRSILKNNSLNNMISEKQVIRFAAELGTVLFDKRATVDSWIFKSPEQRLNEAAVSLIQEKILRQGLLKAWPGYRPNKTHAFDKLVKSFRWSSDKLATFQNSRLMSVLAFPFTLPKIHNNQIGDDLMHRILRDGFDAHAEEIRLTLRSQTRIDAYNTFKRIYSASVMGTVMVTYLISAYDQVTEEMNKNAQHQDELLKNLSNEIDALAEMRLAIVEQAYQDSLSEFIKVYGEAPTAEEQTILRRKIENALLPTEE